MANEPMAIDSSELVIVFTHDNLILNHLQYGVSISTHVEITCEIFYVILVCIYMSIRQESLERDICLCLPLGTVQGTHV